MTLQTEFGMLCSDFYAELHMASLGDFYRLCFDYFGFSLILKGFSIGQEIQQLIFSYAVLSVVYNFRFHIFTNILDLFTRLILLFV